MTTTLKVREDGVPLMAITASTPPRGHGDVFHTLDEWKENIEDFTATMKEPPPLDHRRVFDRFNAVPMGTTAARERAASEDQSRPKAEAIDPDEVYAIFNGKKKGARRG